MRVFPLVLLRGRRVSLVLVGVVVLLLVALPRIRKRRLIRRVVRKHQADVLLPGRGGFPLGARGGLRLGARDANGAKTRLGCLVVTALERARHRGVHVVHQRLVDPTAFGNERAAYSMRRAVRVLARLGQRVARVLGRPRIDGDLRLQEGAEAAAFTAPDAAAGGVSRGTSTISPDDSTSDFAVCTGATPKVRADRAETKGRPSPASAPRDTPPSRLRGRASAEGPRAHPRDHLCVERFFSFSTTCRWQPERPKHTRQVTTAR